MAFSNPRILQSEGFETLGQTARHLCENPSQYDFAIVRGALDRLYRRKLAQSGRRLNHELTQTITDALVNADAVSPNAMWQAVLRTAGIRPHTDSILFHTLALSARVDETAGRRLFYASQPNITLHVGHPDSPAESRLQRLVSNLGAVQWQNYMSYAEQAPGDICIVAGHATPAIHAVEADPDTMAIVMAPHNSEFDRLRTFYEHN